MVEHSGVDLVARALDRRGLGGRPSFPGSLDGPEYESLQDECDHRHHDPDEPALDAPEHVLRSCALDAHSTRSGSGSSPMVAIATPVAIAAHAQPVASALGKSARCQD